MKGLHERTMILRSPEIGSIGFDMLGEMQAMTWSDPNAEKARRLVATWNHCLGFTTDEVEAVSMKQVLIALGKYASGCRPGDEGWTPEDQAALDFAMGK